MKETSVCFESDVVSLSVRAIRAPAGEMSERLEEQTDSVHVKISLARALLHGHATIKQGPCRGRCHFQQHTPIVR